MSAPVRKWFDAVCWYRGPVAGPLTDESLSALLRRAAESPQPSELRCQIRCSDGFSLRLHAAGDEGFVSDEETASAADDRLQEELRVSDHALKKLAEEDSSSANSSCSDADEPAGQASPPPPPGETVIHGCDILFCHTDRAEPRAVVFVARRPQAGAIDSSLEAIVLGCARETLAAELYTSYHELTRRLKWERYTNSKRKSDVMRASFRNVTDSLRLRAPPPLPEHQPLSLTEPAESPLRADSGPCSLPQPAEISRILSLSTPESGWARRTEADELAWGRGFLTPTRYSHNKGPAPAAPPPRKHPTNPNLLLVPTKNGLEPYRVVTGGERPPVLPHPAEFAPHAPHSAHASRADWAAKMAQFDANNNRPRPPARHQLYWMPGGAEVAAWGGAWRHERPEIRPRARSKSPTRSRAFELPGALSQALRGLTSHLRRAPAEAPAAVVVPKSVMKKADRATGSPEAKRVTFSAYSTVQVMD